MENPRPEKVAVVEEVRERLDGSSAVLVTEYRGLTVKQLSELRNQLRPIGGGYRVYKNTLARRATGDAGLELDDLLVGPTALTFVEQTPEGVDGDVVAVAKVLRDFAKTSPNLVIKGGFFEGNRLEADEVTRLADIEPREVLLAQLAGLMAAPLQQFAGLLQALPRDLAYGLQALIDAGGAAGAPGPSADASDEDTPADESSVDASTADEPSAEASTESTEENETPDGEGEGS